MISNRNHDLDLAEKSQFDFPGQADDNCWPAVRLAWQSWLLFPPVSLALFGSLKCPGANSCWRWGRKAWQEQVAPPVSQGCQIQQLITQLGEGTLGRKTKMGSHSDRGGS